MMLGKHPKKIVVAGLLLLVAFGASIAIISTTTTKAVAIGRDGDPHAGKIGCGMLRQLSSEYEMIQSGQTPVAQDRRGSSIPTTWAQLVQKYKRYQIDAKKRVLVTARVTLVEHADEFKSDLRDYGMEVIHADKKHGTVVGYLPIEKVAQLPNIAHFASASAVLRPIMRTGSINSEGDAVLKSSTFRGSTSYTGAGITVGVVSDSVSMVPPGITGSQSTLDLPAAGVNVLLDGGAGDSDEGRAMLEIIHDIAPGASLAFSSGVGGPAVFATSITNLFGAGCKVIVDDLGYANTPFFNDGLVGQAIDTVTASGAFYASAAGNDGTTAWGATWTPMATTVGGVAGTFHDLGGGNPLHPITVPAGGTLALAFQWDSAYLEGGSALPAFQVNNDLAIIVTDSAGAVVAQVTPDDVNPTTREAFELAQVDNSAGATPLTLNLSYQLVSGPAPTAIKWVSVGSDPAATGQGNVSAIYGHVCAKGTVAVGAVDWNTPTVSETFSSLGGNIPFYFDAAGTRLATAEIRTKPEIAATDGVSTTMATFTPFYGTSAAAPHAAAVAALLWETNPAATRNALLSHMQSTAVNVGAPGADFLSGSGLIQVVSPLPTVPGPGPGPVGPVQIGEGGYSGTGGFMVGGEGMFSFGRALNAISKPGKLPNNVSTNTKPNGSVPPVAGTTNPNSALRGPVAGAAANQQRVFNVSHQQTGAAVSGDDGSSSSTNIGVAIVVGLGLGGAAMGVRRWIR